MKQLVKKLWPWSARLKFFSLSLIIVSLTLLTSSYYQVSGKQIDCSNDPLSKDCSFNKRIIGTEVVTPPTDFSIPPNGIGSDHITLHWRDNASNEQGFVVYYGDDTVAGMVAAHSGTGDVNYVDFGSSLPFSTLLSGTQYCYYVKAYSDEIYSSSAPATPLCATTSGEPPVAPNAPSDVHVEGISALQAKLTWHDNSSDEEGFTIYRKIFGSGNDYAIISPPALPNTTSYIDVGGDINGLTSNTTYCYKVAAYRQGMSSNAVPIDGACGTTLQQTYIQAFDGGGAATSQPALTGASFSNLTPQAPTFAPSDSNNTIGLQTDFSNFTSRDAYNWQVFALHLSTPPTGLTSLTLKWRGIGESQHGSDTFPVQFFIYNFNQPGWDLQRINSNDAVEVLTNTTYNFTYTSQQLQQKYTGTLGTQANTLLFWVKAKAFVQPPNAPNLLTAPDPDRTTIHLQWQDNSNNETGFEIWRTQDSGSSQPDWGSSPYTTINANNSSIATYNDTVPMATDWYYKVRAMRGSIDSDFSNELAISSGFFGPDISLPAVTENSIQIEWDFNNNNCGRFSCTPAPPPYTVIIFRADGDVSSNSNPNQINWTKLSEVTGGQKSYTDSGVTSGNWYTYRAQLHLTDNGRERYSEYSGMVVGQALLPGAPAVPDNLQAEAVSFAQINLTWDSVSNITRYVLERQFGLNGEWKTVSSNIDPEFTSRSDIGLSAGMRYQYRIKAVNDNGESNYSQVAGATTVTKSYYWQFHTLGMPSAPHNYLQGRAVMAYHNNKLYVASNPALGSGMPTDQEISIWDSDTGQPNDLTYNETIFTPDKKDNNVVAMTSFNNRLWLLTSGYLWMSDSGGTNWVQVLAKGADYEQTGTLFNHMTVLKNTLYVLFDDGSLYAFDNKGGQSILDTHPQAKSLAQLNNKLFLYEFIAPNIVKIWSYEDSKWTMQGQWQNSNLICGNFNGLLGLSGTFHLGSQNPISHNMCSWTSFGGGADFSRSGDTDIWQALPMGSDLFLVGTTAAAPDNVIFKLFGSTLQKEGLPISNFDGYKIWSFVAVPSAGENQYFAALYGSTNGDQTIIAKLISL